MEPDEKISAWKKRDSISDYPGEARPISYFEMSGALVRSQWEILGHPRTPVERMSLLYPQEIRAELIHYNQCHSPSGRE